MILVFGLGPFRFDAPRPLDGPFVPHNMMSSQNSPVLLLKLLISPTLRLLTTSGSKKREPKYACLSETKASHSHGMWSEVSSSAPHLLHKGLLVSPIKWRCLLRVLCPVRRRVTALDYVMSNKSLVFAAALGLDFVSLNIINLY